jgi:hypothetical protein
MHLLQSADLPPGLRENSLLGQQDKSLRQPHGSSTMSSMASSTPAGDGRRQLLPAAHSRRRTQLWEGWRSADKQRVVDVSSSGFGTAKDIDVRPTNPILYERGFVVFEADTVPAADNRRRLMLYDTSIGDLKQVGSELCLRGG